MAVSQSELWKLAVASRLLSPAVCRDLQDQFRQVKGAVEKANARTLSEWLISKKVLTRYHASILLAGLPGPFDFSDYRVYGKLETGRLVGMFRAVHKSTRYSTTLQFLAGPDWQDGQTWSSVRDRVVRLSVLDTPHLFRCFEAVDTAEYKFIVYEKCRGKSLATYLEQARTVRVPLACRWIQQLARTIGQLHETGLYVGDLCTTGIFVDPAERVEIRLFVDGAYRAGPLTLSFVSGNRTEGDRFDYVAPELGQLDRAPDHASDIYALGCVFYEMLTGQVPFPGGDAREKIRRHVSEPIQPLENFGVAQEVAQVVTYMLGKNPAIRFKDMVRVVESLEPFIEPHTVSSRRSDETATLNNFMEAIRQRSSSSTVGSVQPSASDRLGTSIGLPNSASVPLVIASGSNRPVVSVVDVVPHIITVPNHARGAPPSSRDARSVGWLWWMGGGMVAVVAAVSIFWGVFFADRFDKEEVEGIRSSTDADLAEPSILKNDIDSVAISDDGKEVAQSLRIADQEIVPDDGQLLWASPTSGAPYELQFVPPDVQLLLFARPEAILVREEGARVIKALGPEFHAMWLSWEADTGLQLSQIKTMILGFHSDGGTQPRVSLVARTSEPVADSVKTAWGAATKANNDFGELYQLASGTILVPATTDETTIVLGNSRDVSEVVEREGAPPLLRREMRRLLERTDEDRHVTLLAVPNFFFAEGRSMFAANRAKMLGPLSWFLGDGIQAVSASLHFEDHFFWELRFAGQVEQPAQRLSDAIRQRINEVPTRTADYFYSLRPSPYWNELALRFPHMVSELQRYARVGHDDGQVVANGCLEIAAAHNLVLGCELAIASTPGLPIESKSVEKIGSFETIHDVLREKKISLDFPQQSLEFAIRDMAQEVMEGTPKLNFDFKIKIDGVGLETEGITRNQQIREFNISNRTVESALTEFLGQVNPELVWVVCVDEKEKDRRIVLVTTRKTAQKNGYDLPKPLVRKKT